MTLAKTNRWLIMLAITIASVILVAGPAAAHLDLDSTTPSDGAVQTKPVTKIKLKFTKAGQPAGDGIQIINQVGDKVPATVASPDAGITWVATPSAPLEDGKYGVKWRVAAPDAHPKNGAFRFTVDLPATAITPDAGAAPGSATDVDSGLGASAGADADALDSFLAEPNVATAERVSWFGSTMALAGAVLGIGGLAFLGFVMAGRRSEVSLIIRRVRWSGAVLVVGTMIQITAQSAILTGGDWATAITPSAFGDVLTGSFAWSILLRLAGGVLIVVGSVSATSPAPRAALAQTHSEPGDPIVKASLRRSPIALAGAGLYLASFLFDGHTATQTPLALVWATDVAHVLAAATWVGGIAMLATVLWRRNRADHALDAAYLAVRFSLVAGASLVLAGIAGLALTVEILDEPSQLWASVWGQVLIAKVLLVAVVAAIGAYNHFRLIPMLEQVVDLRSSEDTPPVTGHPTPGIPTSGVFHDQGTVAIATRTRLETASDKISRKLWFTTYAEVILLLGVIGLTAWLVSSSANL